MKRYTVFTAGFVLAPMISGTFVGSAAGRASGLEWAHIITGYASIYLILFLLLKSVTNGQGRLPAAVALALSLAEAIPGMPRLHAFVSPVLFATLAWAGMALTKQETTEPGGSRWVFVLPAMVLTPIYYGVGYRHQTSGIVSHLGAALTVAGVLLIFCKAMNDRHPDNKKLRRACNLTIAAVLFQVVFGAAAFIIRLLEIEGGLWLAVARTAHITGAAPVLAASTELAIQYRRSVGLKDGRSVVHAVGS